MSIDYNKGLNTNSHERSEGMKKKKENKEASPIVKEIHELVRLKGCSIVAATVEVMKAKIKGSK